MWSVFVGETEEPPLCEKVSRLGLPPLLGRCRDGPIQRLGNTVAIAWQHCRSDLPVRKVPEVQPMLAEICLPVRLEGPLHIVDLKLMVPCGRQHGSKLV
jgi:hypothetical protein